MSVPPGVIYIKKSKSCLYVCHLVIFISHFSPYTLFPLTDITYYFLFCLPFLLFSFLFHFQSETHTLTCKTNLLYAVLPESVVHTLFFVVFKKSVFILPALPHFTMTLSDA